MLRTPTGTPGVAAIRRGTRPTGSALSTTRLGSVSFADAVSFVGGSSGPTVLPGFPSSGPTTPSSGGPLQGVLDVLGTGLGAAACSKVPASLRSTCLSLAAAGVGALTGGGGSQTESTECPGGLVLNVQTGLCELPGSPADLSTPGGPSFSGSVMGVFGAPAVAPRLVGQISNDRGEVGPVFRCPGGTVLGKDNLCYAKGSIPNKLRKWPKAPRPPITRRDAVAIRRAESAKNRVKNLAGAVGFTCKKR